MGIEFFSNKKIGFIGLGISNLYLANYLVKLKNKIFITEEKNKDDLKESLKKLDENIEVEFGKNSDKILDSDIVIRSPGIPLHNPLIKKILSKRIPVFTELEVSYQIIKSKLQKIPKIIAITGTNGKTTTTTLTGDIIKSFYSNVIVAGNIGVPLAKYIDEVKEESIIVLEVSSYQLEDIVEFKPDIACILNISNDHLEHHLTIENYILAKLKIFLNQKESDFAILNYDDQYTKSLNISYLRSKILYFSLNQELKEGCFYNKKDKRAIFRYKNITKEILVESNLPGEHNLENILVSIMCGILSGVPKENIEKVIKEFKGVEHRLEFVKEIKGVIFINDSKSTNVDSTLVALKSFDKPIHLILGGRHKGASYSPLIPLIKQKVRSILLIGEAQQIIYSELKDVGVDIYKCETLDKAVKKAKEIAKSQEIVLFSPACSSFDQFNNFEHRGKVFKELVENL